MKIVEISGAGISPISITSAMAEQKTQQQALQAQQPQQQPAPMSLSANPTPA